MSSLKFNEKQIFESLFDRGGYVLDFSDRTFNEFFNDFKINIFDPKFAIYGTSKMKRLRAFWELEPDMIVGEVIMGLLDYASTLNDFNKDNAIKAQVIISRLVGKQVDAVTSAPDHGQEEVFLSKEFSRLNLALLKLDSQYETIIIQRIDEINKTLQAKAALSVIFLCGSTLEGLLLDIASKQIQKFNTAKSAPKDKEGKVRLIYEWTLENLINTAHEVGHISLDVKKYCHTLRDFRNYIHPREQAAQAFNPDMRTAKISWQVLQAAIADLTGERK